MGWILAILSGSLAALSYPTRFGPWILPSLGFLGFFCWVPLLRALEGVQPRRAFALAFVAGLFHYGVSQYWLYAAIHHFGGLSASISMAVFVLLMVILSAMFAVIFPLSDWTARRLGVGLLWLRPCFWVACEYLRHYWPAGGYPWSQLAYSQVNFLPFLQGASIYGAYGLTFLLLLCNESINLFISQWKNRFNSSLSLKKMWPALTVGALVLATCIFGVIRLSSPRPRPLGQIPLGIVQGNVAQEDKWNGRMAQDILENYAQGTKALESRGARLILWPEASLPFAVPYDSEKIALSFGQRESRLLLGTMTRKSRGSTLQERRNVHNSALLVGSEGQILDYYHKKELVPFGEYVPYQEFLFFARKLVAEVGNIVPGESFRPIRYGEFLLGVLICYEDIFPYISRQMVQDGANALINLTNDAWYGYSSAAYQHLAYSQMRAVETGRAVVRATNTGLSALIDPWGRVLWQGGMYTREDFLTELPLYGGKTCYVRWGDFVAWLSALFSLLAMLRAATQKKEGRHV